MVLSKTLVIPILPCFSVFVFLFLSYSGLQVLQPKHIEFSNTKFDGVLGCYLFSFFDFNARTLRFKTLMATDTIFCKSITRMKSLFSNYFWDCIPVLGVSWN